jgi:cytochrome c oxidase cbb3-type subunit I/II
MHAAIEQRGIPVASRLVRAHTYASFAGLVLSAIFGLLVSIKFHAPAFLSGHAWDTWGRLRYDHTQGILYAWLGNAFIAFVYYAVPFLTRRPIASERLGWVLFVLYNIVAVLGGWSLVLGGVLQPLEWAEFPLVIAAVIELCFALLIVQVAGPFLKCGAAELYVSGWYILGGLTFTFLAYPLGNIVPHALPGAMGAAFSGLWIHDAVGLFVTPLAVAIEYYVISAVTRKPIYSHFYSMVGFWLLFLVYPLNGIHHYIYTSLPMGAQHVSEAASIYQGIDVIIVVANLLLSIGLATESRVLRDVPLRFVWTSIVLYLIVSLQGSAQAVMSFSRFIHFTDWVIGHSHLAMIGFASFAAMGGVAHIWQRMPGVRYNPRALRWSYWLLVVGLLGMVCDLSAAGVVQGILWQQHVLWMESVRASRPYWILRTLNGVVLLAGFLLFGLSLLTGRRNPDGFLGVAPETQTEQLPRPHSRALTTAYAATFGAGVVFFFISFLALGVYPAIRLHQAILRQTPPGAKLALNASELRGERIYAQDGCAYCHTLQVRFTRADEWRFGAPTQAWETQQEYPQMWGTRRIGPDLAREAGKRPEDWQLVHLFNPRYLVPGSVMPAYAWMFDGSPDRPRQQAIDLVAYLNTLGAAREAMAPDVPESTAVVPVTGPVPAALSGEGRSVYMQNCSGCHGVSGNGQSPGGRALRPQALDLTGYTLRPDVVWNALQHGVPGSSMPAWNLLATSQMRAVANYVLAMERSVPAERPGGSVEDAQLLDAGQRIYIAHCVSCHGKDGGGDGSAAVRMLPRPANFHQMMPSYPVAADVIHNGVPGSAMPAWPLLTPVELQAVTRYLRSLYRPPDTPTEAAGSGPAASPAGAP